MKFSINRIRTRPSAASEQRQNQNLNQISTKIIAMTLSMCLNSESASMAYCCQSQPLYWASQQNELSSSEPATMAIGTLFTSLKIDSPAYQLRSSYGIAYNQHIKCINISFYTHALILFNSAPLTAASAASAAASAAFTAAFQLELPRTMLVYNVFHLSLLWKAVTDFLPGQKQTPSPPFIMNESRGMEGQDLI